MSGRPRVLFSTGSLHIMDVAAAFEVAADVGFDGVEVICDQRWSTRDPGYLSALQVRARLPVVALHAPFDSMGARLAGWPRSLKPHERLEWTVQLAELLGAEVVVLHLPPRLGFLPVQVGTRRWLLPLPWRRDTQGMKRWMESGLAAYQATTSVKIAVENLPGRTVLGLAVGHAWWNSLAEWPQVHRWLTLDTTHWGTTSTDPLAAYAAARGRVAHVHLSDYGPHEHQLPGTGRLPLEQLLQALAADGFSGTISLELDPSGVAYTNGARLRQQLSGALAFCREHLEPRAG